MSLSTVINRFKTIRPGSIMHTKLILIEDREPRLLDSIETFLMKDDRESAIRMVNMKTKQLGMKSLTNSNVEEDEDGDQTEIINYMNTHSLMRQH